MTGMRKHIDKTLLAAFCVLFPLASLSKPPLEIAEFTFWPSESVISGVMKLEQHFGPSNYGENPETDQIEHTCILFLDQPISVKVTIKPDELNVDTVASEVHLISYSDSSFKCEDNIRVTVKGQFLTSHTGHHRSLLLFVDTKKVE